MSKITNLLDKTSTQPSKFRTKTDWNIWLYVCGAYKINCCILYLLMEP